MIAKQVCFANEVGLFAAVTGNLVSKFCEGWERSAKEENDLNDLYIERYLLLSLLSRTHPHTRFACVRARVRKNVYRAQRRKNKPAILAVQKNLTTSLGTTPQTLSEMGPRKTRKIRHSLF